MERHRRGREWETHSDEMSSMSFDGKERRIQFISHRTISPVCRCGSRVKLAVDVLPLAISQLNVVWRPQFEFFSFSLLSFRLHNFQFNLFAWETECVHVGPTGCCECGCRCVDDALWKPLSISIESVHRCAGTAGAQHSFNFFSSAKNWQLTTLRISFATRHELNAELWLSSVNSRSRSLTRRSCVRASASNAPSERTSN